MTRTLALVVVMTAGLAMGQGAADYNKGLAAYTSGDFVGAARSFYLVANGTSDGGLRLKAEYYLASSFQRGGLPFTAFVYFTPIVKAGPQHPYHLKAVEAFIALQETLDDDYLIPSILNNSYDRFSDAWSQLPLEVLSRINYLIGRISHRKGLLEDARQFLEAVPETSQVHARAQYLLGITFADPRFPPAKEGGKRANLERAIGTFEGVLKLTSPQKDFESTRQLTLLALGRANYNLGDFDKSVSWYEQVPRFSKFWDQALFENGFARFQNDDPGGGLGSLQGLYAPQFAGAFQPESWILTATIYYFACLYDEAKATLAEYERLYLPMADALKPLVDSVQKDVAGAYALVAQPENSRLPKPVLNWVRGNQRMLGLFGLLTEIDKEKAIIEGTEPWRAARLSGELATYLEQNRGTLVQVAGTLARARLVEANKSIRAFADQAEIIRFEVAKAEKEQAEAGVNRAALLDGQPLFRPKMPAENWNYWKFDGEFWRDEIGYYQYTLRRGCVERSDAAN